MEIQAPLIEYPFLVINMQITEVQTAFLSIFWWSFWNEDDLFK